MNQQEKKIIIQEIRTWRDSKLLPAEYCDFLLNLYAEGDSFSAEEQNRPRKNNRTNGGSEGLRRFFNSQASLVLLVMGVLLLFVIFAFNFTLFPLPMQIGVLALVTVVVYFLAIRSGQGPALKRLAWTATSAVLVAVDGYFYLSKTGLIESRGSVIGVMSVVFLLWVLTGGIGRSRLISGIGWCGLLLMYAMLIERIADIGSGPYGVQHFYWLIPAILSLVLAYLLGRGRVYIAPVFFVLGLLSLFGPDLRLLVYGGSMDFFIQAIIFLKLAVLISVVIVFRLDLKNWWDGTSVEIGR